MIGLAKNKKILNNSTQITPARQEKKRNKNKSNIRNENEFIVAFLT